MMRQSSLLKWAQNNKHSNKGTNRNWIHTPDALQRGHIAYLVKFLGNTEVEQAKGIEVVKEGIRKLKFSQQLKRAEGTKVPKVELTISVDGVAVQEPKTKRILHQYPLHRISYCADDKSDKKFFSFIAKEQDSEKHTCFVFESDKLAEEITLTIGQAFDLAYRRFLETSGRDLEMRKQMMILQKKVQTLEAENSALKHRISDLQLLKDRQDIENYKKEHNITDFFVINGDYSSKNSDKSPDNNTSAFIHPPPIPPRQTEKKDTPALSPSQELLQEFSSVPTVGTKLENLILDDIDDFNPRAVDNGNIRNDTTSSSPIFNPLPSLNGNQPQAEVNTIDDQKDLFGAEPFVPVKDSSKETNSDPFGMGDFGDVPSTMGAKELENAIGVLDKRISEMMDGFSRGLSFGNDDFSVESLDPLNSKNS